MPIPDLNEHGLLPVGIHDCTFAEVEQKFGQNRWIPDEQSSSRREVLCPNRRNLCDRLAGYLADLRRASLVVDVLVDGSFVTQKPDPNDIDLIVALPAEHDFSRALAPLEYNVLSKRRVRENGYPFDVFVVASGDPTYQRALALFQQVRGQPDLTKGLLRVRP
jgi:hypothetical protein